MDISEVRKCRLLELIDGKFSGRQVDFCTRANLSQAQVSQWLTGYRKIGEKVARRIEESLALENFWLDKREIAFRSDVMALAEEMQKLSPEQVSKIRALVIAFNTAEDDDRGNAYQRRAGNDHQHLMAAQERPSYRAKKNQSDTEGSK